MRQEFEPVGALTSALDLIGGTPLVQLNRIYRGPGRLLAKAEFVQPGGSVKDRAALAMITSAVSRGELRPGQTVVEMTSGNMGAGLAVVCSVLKYPLVVVMSAGNSPARARMMEGLGAEVVIVPQVDGSPGQVTGADIAAATVRASEIAADRGAFHVDQFNNEDTVRAHEVGTGPEVYEQTEGKLDYFVSTVGSGGTFIGASRYLKQQDPRIKCVVVEPSGAEVLAGKPVKDPRHLMQGTGYGIVPTLWQPELADLFVCVTDDEVVEYRRRLATEEGLYLGFSAAANVCAAIRLLEDESTGPASTVVTVLCDTGLKY